MLIIILTIYKIEVIIGINSILRKNIRFLDRRYYRRDYKSV